MTRVGKKRKEKEKRKESRKLVATIRGRKKTE